MAKRCLSLDSAITVNACLDVGFYDTTCPSAETIMQQTMARLRWGQRSVLIDRLDSEEHDEKDDAPPNNDHPSLWFFGCVILKTYIAFFMLSCC
jgi:hypothetical protein